MIPDNNFASVLFSNLEVYLNHELITSKSSDSDYPITNFLFFREGFNNESAKHAFVTEGYFSDYNRDLENFTDSKGDISIPGATHIAERRAYAEESQRNGVKYYRYYLTCAINHGLARQDKPLPSGIPITLVFNRAKAAKSLIQIAAQRSGSDYKYEHESVPLITPLLECYFVDSVKAENFYKKTKLYDISVPFLDTQLRRELLTEGIGEFSIKLHEGLAPAVYMLGFQSPDRFDGKFNLSSLKFVNPNILSLEMCVDGTPISHHPLKVINNDTMLFYTNYLKTTNRWQNYLSTGGLEKIAFDLYNFIIFANLKQEGIQSGQITLNLKFNQALTEKLLLLYCPVIEKRLIFDSYQNVSVQ